MATTSSAPSPAAVKAREKAREGDGKFGEQERPNAPSASKNNSSSQKIEVSATVGDIKDVVFTQEADGSWSHSQNAAVILDPDNKEPRIADAVCLALEAGWGNPDEIEHVIERAGKWSTPNWASYACEAIDEGGSRNPNDYIISFAGAALAQESAIEALAGLMMSGALTKETEMELGQNHWANIVDIVERFNPNGAKKLNDPLAHSDLEEKYPFEYAIWGNARALSQGMIWCQLRKCPASLEDLEGCDPDCQKAAAQI